MEFLEKGNILSNEGKLEEAATLYDKAINLNPNYVEAYYKKANILGDMGRNEEAIVCYDKAISLDPNYVNAYNNKGIALRLLGKNEEAVICYDQAIKLNPDDADFYHNKGIALGEMGKNQEAIVCYDEAIRLNPNDSGFYQNKGVALEDMGKNEEAILCYEKALSINPNSARAHHKKGNVLGDLDKNEEAITCYDRAISLNPNFVNSYNNKGIALRTLGKYEEAIACYDKAINLDPNDPDFYHNKGIALGEMGKNQEAIVCYDKVISLNPNFANVYNNQGVALETMGEKEKALICYDRAISLNPSYSDAYNNKGIALRTLGKNEEAVACYDKAIGLNPKYAQAYHNKGVALGNMGKNEEAVTCYDKAIHFSNFKEPLYFCNRGRLFNELGQTEKALKDFKSANNLVQQDIWGHVSPGNKAFIKKALSTILELERRMEETEKRLNRLDQKDSDVKNAVDQFKKIQVEGSNFVNQQVAQLDDKKEVTQEDIIKANEKIQELEKSLKELNERLSHLAERVVTVEKTVQEMKNDIEKIREDMKISGVMDKARIIEGFKDLEKSAPQLYAYAKAFYWTLMNYFMAYRNSSTGVVQGNTESVTNSAEKFVASTTSYAIEFAIDVIESIPFVEKIMRVLNETMKTIYESVKERRFENRVNIINMIIMEHSGEEEVHTTVAFTALDVAFKLRAGNSFDFDVTKSDNIWEKLQGKLNEQIEKIKKLTIAELVDLYEGPAAAAALRDVLLLLAYLYERYEFVTNQRKNQQKPFYEQFAGIILLKKYTEILGINEGANLEKTQTPPLPMCGGSCALF